MIEILFFSLLLFLGIVTIVSENRDILRYIYIQFSILFILIMRLNGFEWGGYQKDMITYSIEMKSVSLGFYYLREFVFWFGLRFAYFITNSEMFSIILLDFVWIYYLLRTININEYNKLGRGLIVVLLTSFPFLFGYQNIYRQFYATIILLYSYSILDSRPVKSFWIFLISIFIHNLTVFMLPVFLIRRCYRFGVGDRLLISSFISFLFVVSLPLLLFLKSSAVTEFDFSLLYLLIFLMFFIYSLYRFRQNIYFLINNVPSLWPMLILMGGYIVFQQEMIAERLGMMFIIFLLYDLYSYSNTLKSRFSRLYLRLFILFLFTIPVFLFDSAMKFLL